ncbi:hypothetical protein BVZ79_01297B, partial [Haemophilus influenzae]
LQNWLHKLFL